MRRASDAPWKVWGNRLAYRMSRAEKISGRRGDQGRAALVPASGTEPRQSALLSRTGIGPQPLTLKSPSKAPRVSAGLSIILAAWRSPRCPCKGFHRVPLLEP